MNVKKILFVFLAAISFGCQMREKKPVTKPVVKIKKQELPDKIKTLKNVTIYSLDQEPEFDIQFIDSVSFGNSEEVYFHYIGQFRVDRFNRVYIADKHSIKVFGSDGDYLKTLGGKGRGPGEFNNFGALTIKISSDVIYIYDDIMKRITVFNLDSLTYSHTINLYPEKWKRFEGLKYFIFAKFYVYKTHKILAGFTGLHTRKNRGKRFIKYYMMDQEGNLISDKIFEHIDIKFYDGTGAPSPLLSKSVEKMPVASTRSLIMDVGENGFIYTVWTENFLIKIFNPKGKYLRSIYYTFQKSKLNTEKIIESYRGSPQLYTRAQNMSYSDTWPAINYFFIDNKKRIWVSTITDAEDTFTWFVLKSNGKLLAKFTWPGQKLKRHLQERKIKMVKGGYLYGIKENDTTGIKNIIRFKISFKHN